MLSLRRIVVVVSGLALMLSTASAQEVRLLGITGHFGFDDFGVPDGTVFEIDVTDGSVSELAEMTAVPEAHVIGYNPLDGLLYHTAGGDSWSSDPVEDADCCSAFRDHQYMETYNLETGEFNAIFNANPPESPDAYPAFGLPAPRPSWVFPEEIRLITQTDSSFQARGENEYKAIRSLTFSEDEGLFYAADWNTGIWTITTDGQTTNKLSETRVKALTFFEKEDGSLVLMGGGYSEGFGGANEALMYEIDPTTGEPVGEAIELGVPEGSEFDTSFGSLYGLAQHPETKVLYGLRQTDFDGGGTKIDRELITIDPLTGETQLIANTELHLTSLTFVRPPRNSDPCDLSGDGSLGADDADELTAAIAGGSTDLKYDFDNSGTVDSNDIVAWLHDCAGTWVGDVDFDGLFDSNDLITVAAALTYENDVDAFYSTGDFDGNLRFDSSDLIAAAADNGYENGPYTGGGVAAVPEPAGLVMVLCGLAALAGVRRR